MKIDRITFTGADDNVKHNILIELSKHYPMIEWGILFSKNKITEYRYPSMQWISKVRTLGLNLSAHFCGWYAKEVLENENFGLITSIHPDFKRVQLNYSFRDASKYKLDSLIESLKEFPEVNVILQYNKTNAPVLDKLMENELPSNLHFLFDSSGGNGVEIKSIREPFINHYTGYSGGLSPDNIEKISSMIKLGISETNVFIDMESGVRTDNQMDFTKIKEILDKV